MVLTHPHPANHSPGDSARHLLLLLLLLLVVVVVA
jgi:hypothetical protein